MSSPVRLAVVTAALACLMGAPAAWADPLDPNAVPPRSSISVRTNVPNMQWGTTNQHQERGALSLSKLYIVDYALRHGDNSAEDRALAERMIRYSDDSAASAMEAKYPKAIELIAAEYHLSSTHSGNDWQTSTTSTADVADFLNKKRHQDPDSPIFDWMSSPGAVAADGTVQDWGTTWLPGALGTKWGWSDFEPEEVASASYGIGFTVAAHTYGSGADQTTDVLSAVPDVLRELVARRLTEGVREWEAMLATSVPGLR
ncbi:hypothetical protein [Nocardia sp. XZ_19_385]|uniref:hypothetical protein n=1 Tax=Nocardia sp. XZ_19_385 TaxID=2769488 RepID=UPI00188FEEBB|nr:hypothetical protein [Nocardia sp. XZ_19_385]